MSNCSCEAFGRRTISRVVAVMLLATLIGASGCGSPSTSDQGSSAEAGSSATVHTSRPGTLTVGMNVAFAPFESRKGGTPVGFDVDVADELARRLGLKLSIQDNPSFDALIPNLQQGQYDAVISAVTIKPERRKVVDFTHGYFDDDQSLLVNSEKTPELTSAQLPASAVIGVQKNTTSADAAQRYYAGKVKTIRDYDDTFAALGDLAVGRLTGVVADYAAGAFAAKTQFNGSLAVVGRLKTSEELGIAVRKGNVELLHALDGALSAMREDKTLERLSTKWFGQAPAQ